MLRKFLRERRDAHALMQSGLFDEAWYRKRHLAGRPGVDPARHYVRHGAALGHDPHPRFDARWYLSHNTDVREAGINPFVHYVTSGVDEKRAPNPWGVAAWAPASPPLIDFMRDQLEREATGVIDMLTPDFVSGWISCSAPNPHLIVALGGERHIVRSFETRPDLAALCGRQAFAFMLQFPRRQALGTRVEVGFGDSTALLGSPGRVGDASRHSSASPVVVNIDTPHEAIARRITTIAGWIRLPDSGATIDIAIDGERQPVDYLPRADIVAFQDSPYCIGFKLRYDACTAAAGGQNAVELEIMIDGQRVAQRVLDLALEPVAADQPPLSLFMHVPKTAGVSLTAAIDEVPDPRAFWLYDDEHGSIADKLARLSPHAFDDLRIVGGHFAHGIDRAIHRPTRYFTVLREPASYLKSFFFYCKYVRRHACLRDLNIYEAVETRVEPYLDNAFTRHFARVPCDRAVVAADLVTALGVMERDFAFVGFVEQMEESIAQISRILGYDIPVRVENRTPPTTEAEALDEADRARWSAPYVRFDEMLVARARGRWWSTAGRTTRERQPTSAHPVASWRLATTC